MDTKIDPSVVAVTRIAAGDDRTRYDNVAVTLHWLTVALVLTLFGLAEGAILPVIALSAIDRGASPSVAALVAALIGAASLATNIPAGILATRIGERRSMLVASALTLVGLTVSYRARGRDRRGSAHRSLR